jgi:hypothetical protein
MPYNEAHMPDTLIENKFDTLTLVSHVGPREPNGPI